MKWLIALLLTCSSVLGQGFGSFTYDQPFLAGSNSVIAEQFLFVRYLISDLGLNVGDPVSSLTDSGIYRFNSLSTGTARPYYTNNVSVLNGKPWIVFDGVNDYMQTNFTTVFPQPLHAIWVASLPSVPGAANQVYFDNGSGQGAGGFYGVEGKTLLSAGAWTTSSNQPSGWMVWEFCFDGEKSFVRTNGMVMQYGNCGTNARVGITLGAERTTSANAPIQIAYAAFFTNSLSDALAGSFTTNLASQYGITLSPRDALPTWNPVLNSSVLAAYDFSTLRVNNGQTLALVSDLGSKAYNLIGSNNPTWNSSYDKLTGRAHVTFDKSLGQMLQTNFTSYPQPSTVWFVVNAAANGINVSQLLFDGGGDNLVYQGIYTDNSLTHANAGVAQDLSQNLNGSYFLVEAYFNGASSYVKKNGTTVFGPGNLGSNARKGLTIGASRTGDTFANEDVCFLAIHTNTLSSTESSNVTYYLRDRFKLY